jgi:hypothetical protein
MPSERNYGFSPLRVVWSLIRHSLRDGVEQRQEVLILQPSCTCMHPPSSDESNNNEWLEMRRGVYGAMRRRPFTRSRLISEQVRMPTQPARPQETNHCPPSKQRLELRDHATHAIARGVILVLNTCRRRIDGTRQRVCALFVCLAHISQVSVRRCPESGVEAAPLTRFPQIAARYSISMPMPPINLIDICQNAG